MAKPHHPQSSGAADYAVGYAKPPKASQFKKGQSGNPSGASKKVRARKADRTGSPLDQVILREAGRKITVNENGARSAITTYEAAARKLAISAAQGERSAQKQFFDQVQSAQERQLNEKMMRFGILVQYVTEQAIMHRSTPIAMASAWPHPDDVVLDFSQCSGEVLGPIDADQARPFFALLGDFRVWEARRAQLEAMASHSQGELGALYGTAIGTITDLLRTIRQYVPASFRARLDWDECELPPAALNIEGLDGETVSMVHLPPHGDEMAYGLVQLATGAHSASQAVRVRARLNFAANTASLINRLHIERQNRDAGMAPPLAVPSFAEFYDDFGPQSQGSVDETAP